MIIFNCFQLRKIVTKFRCSDHRLEIETGRHGNVEIAPEERMCQMCRYDAETETHFLSECPLYVTLRLKYLGVNASTDWNNIVQCVDKEVAYNLANFLTKAFEVRTQMLRVRAYFK